MATFGSWPGQAKAEFKLAAVNPSSQADQPTKVWADHQGPVVAGSVGTLAGQQADRGLLSGWRQRLLGRARPLQRL